MKLIKLTAIILTAAMILCSCGEPSIQDYANDSKLQTANDYARKIFLEAETFTTKAQIAEATFDAREYSGTLSEIAEELPAMEKGTVLTAADFETALRNRGDGPDEGVYKVLLDEDYKPIAVLWAADTESSLVGAYPTRLWSSADKTSGNINTADINAAISAE
jgi:hypothetical protein